MKAPKHIENMDAKEQVKIIRREIKKVAPKVSVKMARGTAWGWIDISGSATKWGIFTDAEKQALETLGIAHGMNCANIHPDDRGYWVAKLTGQLVPETPAEKDRRARERYARFD